MTFNLSIDSYNIEKHATTAYDCLFSDEEYAALVELCKTTFRRDFTNEVGVRLDYCNRTYINGIALGVSEVRFFDFLTSNYALFNFQRLIDNANMNQKTALQKLINIFSTDGEPDCVEAIIKRRYLANTVAVSFLVSDMHGNYLITKRNSSVGIADGFVSVTVTGAVDGKDFLEEDPFIHCCQREMCEEMGYEIPISCIEPKMIVCGKSKLQPIVLADAKVNDLNDIVAGLDEHKGFLEENRGHFICGTDDIRRILVNQSIRITEAARTHLESVLNNCK